MWVRRGAERSNLAADRTGIIKRDMLGIAVDVLRGRSVPAPYNRHLKTAIQAALVSISAGRAVIEESAEGANCALSLHRGAEWPERQQFLH